jgi:hypothetical protein
VAASPLISRGHGSLPRKAASSVLRADDHPLQIGLRNDQAIERIVAMSRQAAGMLGMDTRHRQDLEVERQHRSDDRSIEAKLPDRPLDGDFLYRCRADDNLVRLVAQRRGERLHDQAGPLISPEQDLRVDQQPHGSYSKYFCSSGGKGSSKSSAT